MSDSIVASCWNCDQPTDKPIHVIVEDIDRLDGHIVESPGQSIETILDAPCYLSLRSMSVGRISLDPRHQPTEPAP
jgi:hypothetical protein